MAGRLTSKFIETYFQDAEPQGFLSAQFRTPARNFHTSEQVEFDIVRSDEEVAIAIRSLQDGARYNHDDQYVNKELTPPVYKESASLSAFDLFGREPGDNPFMEPQYQANAMRRSFRKFRLLENKVRRAIELQASQVLQTATNTLTDQNGATVYEINFNPKATHFPTAATGWDESGADPIADIESLARVIRTDGKRRPDMLIFGATAWRYFSRNAEVREILDNRRINQANLEPQARGIEGATYQGFLWIENYRYEMYTYDGEYTHPQTSVGTRFIDDEKVVMMSTDTRLDLTYGAIPLIKRPAQEAMRFMPRQFASTRQGFGFTTNAYFSQNGEHLFVEGGTRPLCIPTAIDTFGCIDTNITP